MKASEHLKRLHHLIETFGDLEVERMSPNNLERTPAPLPVLAHRRADSHRPKFFNPSVEEEARRGEPVIRV